MSAWLARCGVAVNTVDSRILTNPKPEPVVPLSEVWKFSFVMPAKQKMLQRGCNLKMLWRCFNSPLSPLTVLTSDPKKVLLLGRKIF